MSLAPENRQHEAVIRQIAYEFETTMKQLLGRREVVPPVPSGWRASGNLVRVVQDMTGLEPAMAQFKAAGLLNRGIAEETRAMLYWHRRAQEMKRRGVPL